MTQRFRPILSKSKSRLIEVASNIWTIEAKEHVRYRPPMQPRYPYTHRAVVIRLNDNSLFIISPIRLTSDIRAEIDALGVVKYLVSPNHLHHLYLGDGVDRRFVPPSAAYGYKPYTAIVTEIDTRLKRDRKKISCTNSLSSAETAK